MYEKGPQERKYPPPNSVKIEKLLPDWGEGWAGGTPREGNGNALQYSRLGNPMDRGAWWATVHGVTRVGHDLVTKTKTIFS